MKNLIFIMTFCAISSFAQQAPGIEWQNTIGGDGADYLSCLRQTTDGGYILGGSSASSLSGDKTENNKGQYNYWVIKLDAAGEIQWQKTIGGSGTDNLTCLQQTSDSGYIIGGHSNSNISGDKTENCSGGGDYWILKLDAAGNIQWQKTIGGEGGDALESLQQTVDGGYILGGESNSNISGDKSENCLGSADYWVVKLDMAGNVQWDNTIGSNGIDYLSSIQQTTDGGYIIGGASYSSMSGDKSENGWGDFDYWVVKINAGGSIEWQNTIGGNGFDFLNCVEQTTDGGYIIGGHSLSSDTGDKAESGCATSIYPDYWILKLDAGGNIQWQNDIGGCSYDDFGYLQQTTDGGYIIGGSSRSNISADKTENTVGEEGYADYWILKLDATGNIIWQKTIGGNEEDRVRCLQQTTDGGYILGGESFSGASGHKTESNQGISDYWVVKLLPETVPVVEPSLVQKSLTIYPNPTTDAIFVRTSIPTKSSLYNAFGQNLLVQTVQDGDKIDLSTLPAGLYFLVETETGVGHKILKAQ